MGKIHLGMSGILASLGRKEKGSFLKSDRPGEVCVCVCL